MTEIANCYCGSKADFTDYGWWVCQNDDCRVNDPNDDEDGTKWNALMSGAPKPQPAGTVRIPVQEKPDGFFIDVDIKSTGTICAALSKLPVSYYITADIPLPAPVEATGEIE